jgi:glycosyltransferase involved in cell wall biosynthesis
MLLTIPELVVFCPLPPKPNGIADYLAEQLPYFCQSLQVCVVIENTAPKPVGISAAITILRLEEYLACDAQLVCVPHLYHVGNNPDTQYMLPVLLNRPGIVIVHDLNLHHLIDLTTLSLGDKDAYVLALSNQYGSAGKLIGKQLLKYNWKGSYMPHSLLMNGSIMQAASHIIVHSEYSAQSIGAMDHQNIKVIPHHLSPEIRQHQPKLKMTYRGHLGLPGDKCVITSMGFIAKAKQIRAVLASLSELKKSGQDFVYVLAGQCKPHEYDVFQDIADYGLQDQVIVTGFLSGEDFFKYLIASDFIVNLRYPSGGESSGTLTRAFGLGLACIVVNIGPFAEIPDNCAIKLNYDENFADYLTKALSELISQTHKRVEIGLNAKRWVEASHNILVTTVAYLEVVSWEKTRLEAKNKRAMDRREQQNSYANTVWCDYLAEQELLSFISTNSAFITERALAGLHWWRNSYLPLHNDEAFLYVSDNSHGLEFAEQLFAVDLKHVTQIKAELLVNGESSRSTVCCERFLVIMPTRLIEVDPVAVFFHLNSLLLEGAIGCITLVWDSVVNNEVPLSRIAVLDYLYAAGFSVERYLTGQNDIDMNGEVHDGAFTQEWCFALTKRSSMVNLSPQPYYPGVCSNLKSVRGQGC